MKKIFPILVCLLLCFTVLFSSCGNINVFLSVRMKGNGNGTVTAFAQNEFAVGSASPSVTLEIYSSDVETADVKNMRLLDSVSSDGLAALEILMLTVAVQAESYLLARASYSVGGESGFIYSDVILYDAEGKRK